jgi:hypothetical protein
MGSQAGGRTSGRRPTRSAEVAARPQKGARPHPSGYPQGLVAAVV